MFDCGILDTDALPYPNITPDEARQINYLFLSHAHKDHTGAVPYLLQLGFQGVIAASPETIRHIGLRYDKIRELDISPQSGTDFEGFQVITGSSGHCPGSLWFYVCFESGTNSSIPEIFSGSSGLSSGSAQGPACGCSDP